MARVTLKKRRSHAAARASIGRGVSARTREEERRWYADEPSGTRQRGVWEISVVGSVPVAQWRGDAEWQSSGNCTPRAAAAASAHVDPPQLMSATSAWIEAEHARLRTAIRRRQQ